jgi:serine/threonine-protein kinase RsbW
MARTLELTLANRADEVPRLVTAVESFGASADLSDALLFRVMLALDEVVTNIMRHAFDDDDVHEITITITADAGVVTIVVADGGRPFDPHTVPLADVHAPLEHRPIGGLGVHLVRSLAQDMAYRRTDGRNVLTLRLTEDIK